MFSQLLRTALAALVGLVVAFTLVIAVEGFSNVVHPWPEGADTSDFEVCAAHVANYPAWVLAVAVLMWSATVFAACWVATWLSPLRHPAAGIVVGMLLTLAAGFNLFMLPYPIWFIVGNMALFPLAIFLAVRPRRPRVADEKNKP